MPLYEYRCEACGETFEVIQKFSDPHTDVCRKCGKGPVNRLQSSPAFQFKGSGWYVTDYAQKGKSSESSSTTSASKESSKEAKSDAGTSAAGESTKTETKTETKPAASTETKPAAKSDT
jgi:putative FmdB family regulatory protein